MRLIHIIPADEHHPCLASKHCNLVVQIVAPMKSRDNVEKVTNVWASNRESIASQSIRHVQVVMNKQNGFGTLSH